MNVKTKRKSLDQHLGEKAARKAECAARGEGTPEKVEWQQSLDRMDFILARAGGGGNENR